MLLLAPCGTQHGSFFSHLRCCLGYLPHSSGGLVRGEGTDHSGKQRLTVWDVAALRCPGPQWHQCTKLEVSDMSGLPTLTAWLCFRAYHWLASPPCFARPWPFGVIPKSFGTFSWNRELPAHSPDRVMYCFLVCCLHGAHGPLGIC